MNVQCYKPEPAPLSLLIYLLVTEDQCQKERRLTNEPNDDFSEATCYDKNNGSLITTTCKSGTTLFPPSDLDYFRVTINSGSIRVYITKIDSIPARQLVSFHLFDKNQKLIFDPEDTKFNSVSATILENRFLTKEDCDSSQCSDFITKNRLIRFDPSIQQIYIKFFPLFPEQFQEGRGFLPLFSTSVDRTLDPSRYGGSPLLQGDFKVCN